MADKNLTVKIRGDNRGLGKSLAQSKDAVNRFGSFLKGFGSKFGILGAGLVGTASAAAAVKLFVDATGEIDKLAKLGKQFGFTTEQIQVFERVAELTGTNLQQLLKGFGQLSKSIVQFTRDGTGPGMKVFKDLGLSAEQLGSAFKKGPVEVLKVLGDSLNKIENPLKRSALLEELLGARNKELAVALFDVTKEFGNAAKDIEDLDLGISKEAAQSVEDYNDAWTRIGNTLTNVKRKVAAGLATELEPAVLKLEEALNNFIKGDKGGPVGKPLGAAINQGLQTLQDQFPKTAAAVQASPFNFLLVQGAQAAAAAFEFGIEGTMNRLQQRLAGGVRGAGSMLGFPLTGAALGGLMAPGAGSALPAPGTGTINGRSIREIMADVPRGNTSEAFRQGVGGGRGFLPAPGTGTINGKSIDAILEESQKQTGFLKSMSESFIIERTGVRTAVAAP